MMKLQIRQIWGNEGCMRTSREVVLRMDKAEKAISLLIC